MVAMWGNAPVAQTVSTTAVKSGGYSAVNLDISKAVQSVEGMASQTVEWLDSTWVRDLVGQMVAGTAAKSAERKDVQTADCLVDYLGTQLAALLASQKAGSLVGSWAKTKVDETADPLV